MATPLILASSSPRRLDLLRLIGIEPTVISADIDETVFSDEAPSDLVLRLSQGKANKVAGGPIVRRGQSEAVIIAADTIVVVGNEILNKPVDPDDAQIMLGKLSGNTHQVLTGLSVLAVTGGQITKSEAEVVESKVTMRRLSDDDIAKYIDSGEPFGKAGAYAIQGYGAVFVTSIEGSFHNVMGLPLHMVETMLGRIGRPLLSWVQDQ